MSEITFDHHWQRSARPSTASSASLPGPPPSHPAGGAGSVLGQADQLPGCNIRV